MIELKTEHDYVVGDTDEWLADISEPNDEAQESFDAYRENSGTYYDGEDVMPWLATLHDDSCYQDDETGAWSKDLTPRGLYHDGAPFTAVSVNEENWLSQDVMVTLAHTAEFGDLLIWQYGYNTGATVHVHSFNGDDDADAYSWSGGAAGHADGSECDSDWILESACSLWPNGGRGKNPKLWELETDDEGNMLCPDHGKALSFVGY